MTMDFTYEAYLGMLALLAKAGYPILGYEASLCASRCAVLRHDVDTSLGKAVEMARIEAEHGVRATYFVLLTTELYNTASAEGRRAIAELSALGHRIGLHFDEAVHPNESPAELAASVRREADILSEICGLEVNVVSMHRPSQRMLAQDFRIPGMLNVYGDTFFRQYKYVSDSRRRWREPVFDVIASQQYSHLHILTHPFWYGVSPRDIHATVAEFINSANRERYTVLRDNITCLEEIMTESEIR